MIYSPELWVPRNRARNKRIFAPPPPPPPAGFGVWMQGIDWTPAKLLNLKLWLRADLGITIATGVSAWADQSGNGNNFIQSVAADQPTQTLANSSINNQASIHFAASTKVLACAGINQASSYTFVVVVQAGAASGEINIVTAASGSNPQIGINYPSAGNVFLYTPTLSGGSLGTTPHLIFVVCAGSSSAIYLDSSSTALVSGTSTSNAFANVSINSGSSPAEDIAEIVLVSGIMPQTQRAMLANYASTRYAKAWV